MPAFKKGESKPRNEDLDFLKREASPEYSQIIA